VRTIHSDGKLEISRKNQRFYNWIQPAFNKNLRIVWYFQKVWFSHQNLFQESRDLSKSGKTKIVDLIVAFIKRVLVFFRNFWQVFRKFWSFCFEWLRFPTRLQIPSNILEETKCSRSDVMLQKKQISFMQRPFKFKVQ
jgi:hypothetical protein